MNWLAGRFTRLVLFAIDLASVGIPTWYLMDTVSLVYGAMIAFVQPFIFRENSLYWRHGRIYRTYWLQIGQLIRSYFVIFILFCVYAFLTEALGARPHPDKLLMLLAYVIGTNIVLRLAFTTLLHAARVWKIESYIVVGTSPRAQLIAEAIEDQPKTMAFLGFVQGPGDAGHQGLPPDRLLGPLDELEGIVERNGADHVVVVLDEIEIGELLPLLDRVAHLPAVSFVYNELFNVVRQRYRSRRIGAYTVTSVEAPHRRLLHTIAKRMMDFAGSLGLLIALSPLFAAIALAIKLNSEGPVFYVSDRVKSSDGSSFRFFKFRTMYANREGHARQRREGIERGFAGSVLDSEFTKVTPREAVTKVGRILRRSSLDELPQLINVLRGDMSLVGPRPCVPYEFERYQDWHKRRFGAKTGMTGLWQVVGRSRTTFDDQVILDLYYVDHQTVWFDIEILLKTLPVVLLGRGGG